MEKEFENVEAEPESVEELPYKDADDELQINLEEEKEEQKFILTPEDEDLPNLVPLYETFTEGQDFIKKLVTLCFDEFTTSWEKNSSYRKKTAETWRLLYCDLPPKNRPYENCANAAIPLALQNMVRYTNKIDTEIFGDWSGIFNFVPTNPQAELIAPIVTEHSNWQIRCKMPAFKRQVRRGLLIFFVTGDVVFHTYYDSVNKRHCHEALTCDDFVTPYTHVSVEPDFSDVPWIARRIPMFKTRLNSMRHEWSNIDKVTKFEAPDPQDKSQDDDLRQTIAQHLGEDSFGQQRGEYEIIHYEGWLKLLGQEDERYCQVVFDLQSKACLKLTIHETADYSEKYRYKYQMNEYEMYNQQLQARQQQMMQQQQQSTMAFEIAAQEPVGSPIAPQVADMGRNIASMPPPSEPTKPNWMKIDGMAPLPPQKRPIHMFTHGVCLEPMLGNLGIGIGRIDAQLNLATNTVWSMFLDAAALGNGKTFITAGNVDFRSPFKVGPGVFNKAKNVMPSDLKNAFYELDFGQANPQLIAAADKLMMFGEQASSTPDLMSGAPGKSGETARGVQARLEQINAMIQVPTQKYADVVVQLAKNQCKLNAVYMDDSEIFYVNRFNEDFEQNAPQMIQAAREMYDNEFDIELAGDLQFKSRAQKVSEADEILQLPNAMPELQMNYAFKYAALKQSLKARGLHRITRELLGPPPPKPVTTFGLPFGTPGTSGMGPMGLQQFPPMPPQQMAPPDAQQQNEQQNQSQNEANQEKGN